MSSLPIPASWVISSPSPDITGPRINWQAMVESRPFTIRLLSAYDQKFPNYLVLPEVRRLIDVCEDPEVRRAIHTFWVTGCRPSELQKLRPVDFLINQREIAPNVVLQTTKRKLKPGQIAPIRSVPVHDPIYLEAMRYFLNGKDPNAPVWPASDRTIRRWFDRLNRALSEVGHPPPFKITANTLRHSFAVNHLLQGTQKDHLVQLMGHEDDRTVLLYTKIFTIDLSQHTSNTEW